jgi:RNA-directed DNA polymerase
MKIGRPDNKKEGRPTASRESERFIVLGGRESRPHGEGSAKPSQSAQETAPGSRPDMLLPTSVREIARKAKRSTSYRAGGLYSLLNPSNLTASFLGLNKKAARGADGISYAEYGRNLKANIGEMVRSLKAKCYRAKMVRRVHIPKGEGKTRPLGIPAVSDKVLQSCAASVLSGLYEADFLPCSFGYRPHRGAKEAVMAVREGLKNRTAWVVEADIRGFFDNLDHDWLMRMLEQRVADRPFLNLIRKWLKAGILEADGNVQNPVSGTPQGGIISPVLANIYLHFALDLWFEKVFRKDCGGTAFLVRYADDFVAGFQHRGDAYRFKAALTKRLEKFKLSLAEEKTGVHLFTRFRKRDSKRFDFLGFEYRWGKSMKGGDVVKLRTSPKRQQKSLAAFTAWVKEKRNKRLRTLFFELNPKLRGYYQYFGVTGNWHSLERFHEEVVRTLFRRLNRRSQKRSFAWKGFAAVMSYYGMERPRITWGREDQTCLSLA